MGKRKILVIGGSGFIGARLLGRLSPEALVATYHTAPFPGGVPFDSASERLADRFFVGRHRITHGILLQGITGIDRCAVAPEATARVNVQGAINAIDDMLDAGVIPIFVSSDGVFDGSRGPWTEDDPTCPILTYGRQAAAVEDHLRAASLPWAIARLTKVVAHYSSPRNILSEWLDAIAQGRLIRCADDQILSPIEIDDVVDALVYFVGSGQTGLYNVAGPEPLSRIDLLKLLLSFAGRPFKDAARIEVCSLSDFDFVEPRPKNCSLSNRKFATASGLVAAAPGRICARLGRHYRDTLNLAAAAR